MRRTVALAALLAACGWVLLRPSPQPGGLSFDPLGPRGREVERAIEERRFADALPIARDLHSAHADDATIAIWIAEIYDGLGRSAEAGDAWSRVLDLTHEADAACPAMPNAYARAHRDQQAQEAEARCAAARDDTDALDADTSADEGAP